jgi:hypothetical protein
MGKQDKRAVQNKSGVVVKKNQGQLIGMKKVKAKKAENSALLGEEEKAMAAKQEEAGIEKAADLKVEKDVALKKGKTAASKKETNAAAKKEKTVAPKKEENVAPEKEKTVPLKKELDVASKKVKYPEVEDVQKKVSSVKREKIEQEEVIATAADQLTVYLHIILEMDAPTLKNLCKDKGILTSGGANLKHKYAFALFRKALMQS